MMSGHDRGRAAVTTISRHAATRLLNYPEISQQTLYNITTVCYHSFVPGGVAQLGERGNRTAEVRSSILLISTHILYAVLGNVGA